MNTLNQWYYKLPRWLRNRYALIVVFVLCWLLLFDRYDFISQLKTRSKISKLEADKAFYMREIEKIKKERNILRNNQVEVEKLARERYLMKRTNEDLYVIVE